MISEIEKWIEFTNAKYSNQRQNCSELANKFSGFYSKDFLSEAHFVIVERIPKPDFPQLRQLGLADFLDIEVQAITYNDTYYILPEFAKNLRLHFHELVHVAQWKQLGIKGFLQRYISEIQQFGYEKSPLEDMAYRFDDHFSQGRKKVDIPNSVKNTMV
ncbi:hypothetical protein [Vibrio sp. 99-8-1]|uniref:hypothetical protein n=1 Tax=Vibrio sp. 99-8-1 TaxID=2607602 RepID=UPI001493983D|nr:hypothetical protein [Vibrio sp. 99-8-1]NOI66433.1 hypothetical protein [Vibrio sp. 99-8-1]